MSLTSGDEASQQKDLKQLQRHARAEGRAGRPAEEFGVFGHGDDATESRVDVSEVVLQRRHLLRVLLRGEDL